MRSSASHLDVRDPSEPEDFGQTALRCMDRDSEVPAVRPGANFLEGAERSHAEDFDRRRGVGVFRKDRQVPVVPPKKEEDKTRDEECDEAGGDHEAAPSGNEEPTGAAGPHERSADDLWHLHNLVLPGDQVRASTYRREEVKTDKVRPERGEKVRVTLTIRVESVEFQAFSDRLRITGVIVEGPQDLGRHHTLNVAV